MLKELALRDRPVAMVVTDQRMPEMTGIEMLAQAREYVPEAKFLLLTAYADTDVAIRAINEIGLDHYLLKPWDPPDERLYPVTDDLLGDWQAAHPQAETDVRIVGHRWSEQQPRAEDLPRPQPRSRTAGWTSTATGRRSGWSSSRGPRRTTCRWCSSPTDCCGPRRRACWPTPSG